MGIAVGTKFGAWKQFEPVWNREIEKLTVLPVFREARPAHSVSPFAVSSVNFDISPFAG